MYTFSVYGYVGFFGMIIIKHLLIKPLFIDHEQKILYSLRNARSKN